MTTDNSVIIVGGGMGGFTAASVAAELGLKVTLVEKGEKVGGSCAYSGGQVWVGGNHVAARNGSRDTLAQTLTYVTAIAKKDATSIDPKLCERWLGSAIEAAKWLDDRGIVKWQVIENYPDYYYPDTPGSNGGGRYLTCAPFDGTSLGRDFDRLGIGPNFPVGITYPEMFSWGGMSSKTEWDWDLVKRRRENKVLTFGAGIAGSLFKGALTRGIEILTSHDVTELLSENGAVTGLKCQTPNGERLLRGPVILATGAHDWSKEYFERYVGIPALDGGSLTPTTIEGDAMGLASALGAEIANIPPWAAPVLPGYKLAEPAWPGDHGFRACWEISLPHTFLVNRKAERFCQDDFHSPIIAAALRKDADGSLPNIPLFMIWDESHHQKYGLGAAMPGTDYPKGVVQSAVTLGELAAKLGIDSDNLERTAARFNTYAERGEDPDFGRGTNRSVQMFRGDTKHQPNSNLGPVEQPPFYGMRMILVNTGIAAAGVCADGNGRALKADGSVIPNLYVVGEASARAAAGVGYNSGYSLSRAMAFGYVAARHVARANA